MEKNILDVLLLGGRIVLMNHASMRPISRLGLLYQSRADNLNNNSLPSFRFGHSWARSRCILVTPLRIGLYANVQCRIFAQSAFNVPRETSQHSQHRVYNIDRRPQLRISRPGGAFSMKPPDIITCSNNPALTTSYTRNWDDRNEGLI